MKALLQVESIKLSRSLGVFLLSIGMPVVFFLIFSSTVQFDDVAMQKAFIQSYMLTMTGFSMSGFALFTFPTMLAEDRKNSWLTFIQHSPLPIWHYYLSKLVRVLLCFVSSNVIVFAVGGLVKGVEMTAQEWVISALLLLVTSIVFLAIGLLLVQIQSEQTMSVVANLLYFVLAIMGGSWMPVSRLGAADLQTYAQLPCQPAGDHLCPRGRFSLEILANCPRLCDNFLRNCSSSE